MRKLQISDVEIMKIAIQQEITRSEDSRYDHRLHGILLVSQGFDCYDVAKWLGHHPTTIERWVHLFEEHGFSGLKESKRPGRPSCFEPIQWEEVSKDLRKSPREFGYTQNLWDGKLLSYHLGKVYKVQLGVRQCQRIFHKMGFRRRKPRPVIASADPFAREAFKKTPKFS